MCSVHTTYGGGCFLGGGGGGARAAWWEGTLPIVRNRHDSYIAISSPFGPLGRGGGGAWGGPGGHWAAVPGTPTHVPQNDPLVALIILNTHFLKKKKKPFSPWGVQSQQPGVGGWLGEVSGQMFCIHIWIPHTSSILSIHTRPELTPTICLEPKVVRALNVLYLLRGWGGGVRSEPRLACQ